MLRADKLFTKVDAPIEALMDAKVVKHLSKLTVTQAECISTSLERFIPGSVCSLIMIIINNLGVSLSINIDNHPKA
jgi:hypothetical protein